MKSLSDLRILVIEDGDEYHESLTRFVPGPTYLRAHNGADSVAALTANHIHIVYLDMRFDRIPREQLVGDHLAVTKEHNGDAQRAWRFLENHQGLFILDFIRASGFKTPAVIAYDFTRETARFKHLEQRHGALAWLPDAVTPEEIQRTLVSLATKASIY